MHAEAQGPGLRQGDGKGPKGFPPYQAGASRRRLSAGRTVQLAGQKEKLAPRAAVRLADSSQLPGSAALMAVAGGHSMLAPGSTDRLTLRQLSPGAQHWASCCVAEAVGQVAGV
jgi:hypothetical protein